MNKAEILKKQVPDFVSGTEVMNEIYNAHGSELDKIVQYNEDTLNQLFVETATWGLSYWEEFFGLPILINQDVKIRRAKIKAHFASFGTVNKTTINRIAKDFGFSKVQIIEDYAPYIVKLIFDNSASGDEININDLIATLRRMCPAHVDFMYIFMFKSWADIQNNNMTFEMMDAYQWRDYTIDFDTSSNVSPIVRLKLWEDGDLFSMLGFNYNYNKIDSYLQSHNHNLTNSKKVLSSNISYSNTEVNGSLTDGITRLSNKIGGEHEKLQTRLLWGYKGENKWPLITKFVYDTNLTLVGAIRKKGVDIPDGTPFNRLETYINNIFTGLTPQGTALPEDVREGRTFINANGVSTGTAKYITGAITPGLNDIAINGYVDNLSIKGEPNLISSNIKSAVSLWDVRGSLSDAKYPDGSIVPDDNIQYEGEKDRAYWYNTNRRNVVNCMNADGMIMLGGTDLRIYDNETGRPYAIFTKSMLAKAVNLSAGLIDNMQITHMSRMHTFVYQDVVSKNLCYIMEFDLKSRNISIMKTYTDYCLSFECSYGGEKIVGFRKSIKSFNNNHTWNCPIFSSEGNEELIPNGAVFSNESTPLGCVYYITKDTYTGNYILNYNFRDGTGPIFSRTIKDIASGLTNPEATCLNYDIENNRVLVGINDKTKLSGSGGNITYSNYAYIYIIDAQGNTVKKVDFSDGHLKNPSKPQQSYTLKNVSSITRYSSSTTIGAEDRFTATFLQNPDADYTSYESIEIDRSINITRHINSLYYAYGRKTAPMYKGDSVYGLYYGMDNYTQGQGNFPLIARIIREPQYANIIK